MRRVLAAAVLVAFMPTAHAQDKAKSDFSTNAEFRGRWFYFQNPGANKDSKGSMSNAESRFKIDLDYKASEKLSAHATLIHSAVFGDSTGSSAADTQFNTSTTDNRENEVYVNQAYAKWMTSDDLSISVGRMNYQVADGTLIGINDWESKPYAFEGLLVNWEQEWGKLQFTAFKLRDQSFNTNTATTSSADPEHNMYGLNFDLKAKPEVIKALNVHVFKNVSDAAYGTSTGQVMTDATDGFDTMRYGAMLGLGFGDIELNLWYEAQGGKVKTIAASPSFAKTEYDYKGSLMAAELAYNLESFMGSRFHVKYHQDSGDTDSTDTEVGTYDGFFTEKHNSAGAMDLFGFGNLTFIQAGWMMKPMDKTDVGLQYTMFSRTEAGTAPATATYTMGTYGTALPSTNNTKDKLGDEIDLWATHHYDANLATTLRLGYFMPGDYFKDATTNNSKDAITQVMIEGKATF